MTSTKRRSAATLLVAAIAVTALLAGCTSPQAQEATARLNADRGAYGLAPLVSSDMLNAKAQMWAQVLAGQDTLFHSNLTDGIGGCWRSLGENVGYGGSIATVESSYMNSPPHRANILSSSYRYVGTGVAWNGNMVFTVQEFMQPC